MNSDISGTLINAKDVNGDTAAHDAADNGYALALDPLGVGPRLILQPIIIVLFIIVIDKLRH